MGAGSSNTSKPPKRKRPVLKHKKINKHKIGKLEIDRYQADENNFRSIPCKIAIIGPARSGKSAIFHRFLNNSFSVKTSHDTAANFGLRLIEYEHSLPVWFEIWDLPTHVPTHGGPQEDDEHYYGSEDEKTEFQRMNAWEVHNVPAYNEEARRTHTDPNTGLVEVLKKDHDAVFMVIEATTFASNDFDAVIDALLLDSDFLNDNTKYEILRVLVVSKTDELSQDELDGILIQVKSVAEDKGIDFVTCSARKGTKSIRDLFKFAAQMTVMTAEAANRKERKNDNNDEKGEMKDTLNEGKQSSSGATFEDEINHDTLPKPKSHRAERLRSNRKVQPMDNLYTTTSNY
jgi:GTPase SAR1 family protein